MKRFVILTVLFTFIAGAFAAMARPPLIRTAIASKLTARAARGSADLMTN